MKPETREKTKPSYALQGYPVLTPDGAGRIDCVNLQPPDFRDTESYSVILDKEKDNPSCKPHSYPPEKVRPLLN